MVLECPYCQRAAELMRDDFVGEWVVCPECDQPFSWRDVQPPACSDRTADSAVNQGNRQPAEGGLRKGDPSSTR
jgi:endogenous inhibitor of DNA gyrase (YacG/DUF329 family)